MSTPAEVETTADTVTIEWADKEFTLPAHLDDADGSVLEAIDDLKLSHVLRSLLGPEQWRQFKATKPKVADYGEMFAEYAKAIGLESVGE